MTTSLRLFKLVLSKIIESSLLHLLHTLMLAQNDSGFLSLKLSNFNLPLPVLVLFCLLNAVVALLDEVKRLRHVFLLLDHLFELTLLLTHHVDSTLGLLDVCLLFDQTGKFRRFVFFELSSFGFSLSKLFPKFGQHLSGGP